MIAHMHALFRKRRPRARPPDAGISMFEAIISLGIVTMILVIMNDIFIINYDFTVKALARVDNDNGAILATRRLGELTRGATAVLSSKTINGTLYTTSTTTLVLQVPSLNSAGDIITGCSDYVAVYRHADVATEVWTDTDINSVACAAGTSVRLDGQKLLTANNDTLTFSYNDWHPYDATRISVFLVNSQTVRGIPVVTKMWTSIFMRNH